MACLINVSTNHRLPCLPHRVSSLGLYSGIFGRTSSVISSEINCLLKSWQISDKVGHHWRYFHSPSCPLVGVLLFIFISLNRLDFFFLLIHNTHCSRFVCKWSMVFEWKHSNKKSIWPKKVQSWMYSIYWHCCQISCKWTRYMHLNAL